MDRMSILVRAGVLAALAVEPSLDVAAEIHALLAERLLVSREAS